MKKIYSAPSIQIVAINSTSMLLQASAEGFNQQLGTNSVDGSAGLVKEERHYDVWDDDWSK